MKSKMKFLLVVLVVCVFTTMGWAQFDAGFLDNGSGVTNPEAFNGSGWYCLDNVWAYNTSLHQWFLVSSTIIWGPSETYPNCNAG